MPPVRWTGDYCASPGETYLCGSSKRVLFCHETHSRIANSTSPAEWEKELVPLLARDAKRRGLPLRIEGEHITLRLDGEWKRWRYEEAFVKLIPLKVARAQQQLGVVAPQLVQMVGE